MRICKVEGCEANVGNPKGFLCLEHWKGMKDGVVRKCGSCGRWNEGAEEICPDCSESEESAPADTGKPLTATALGRTLGISAQRVNLILAELGWIERGPGGKGWKTTRLGSEVGAQQREASSGAPFAVWPAAMLENRNLLSSVRDVKGDEPEPAAAGAVATAPGFREKFPAKYRATDGHLVRSRAEMLIDNWLYMSGIVHAVERKLPIEEDVYCDFYIPSQKVYIEFWGMEGDSAYDDRKQEKQAIYERYGFSLVELHDEDIANLDDTLPRKLIKFGVVVD